MGSDITPVRHTPAEYLECGKIINIHGLDGTVKLESWCDTPDVLASLPCIYFAENGAYRRSALCLHTSRGPILPRMPKSCAA